MKANVPLLIASIAANLALGWALIGEAPRRGTKEVVVAEARSGTVDAANAGFTSVSRVSGSTKPEDIRDGLRAIGFPEEFVRAAIRAQVEAPRLAQQRAAMNRRGGQAWWLAGPGAQAAAAGPEWRAQRLAERSELTRLFGPIGSMTREDLEPYAFLSDEKAARVAAIRRDVLELRDEIPADGTGPASRAEAADRNQQLYAAWDREVAAVLTPEEFKEYKMRTGTSAVMTGHAAKYFDGTAEEFRVLYETDKAHRAATEAAERDPFSEASRAISWAALEKMRQDQAAGLGPERYAAWKRSMQTEFQAIAVLQRRFPQPPETIAELEAIPRRISEEAMVIAREPKITEEQKLAKLRAIANEGRARVRALLGPDLGEAYNEASARGWLNELEEGKVPMYQPNGERAIFMAVHREALRRPSPSSK